MTKRLYIVKTPSYQERPGYVTTQGHSFIVDGDETAATEMFLQHLTPEQFANAEVHAVVNLDTGNIEYPQFFDYGPLKQALIDLKKRLEGP